MCNNVWYDKNRFDFIHRRLYPLPCGYCQGCKIDRTATWFHRLTAEFVSRPSAFLTCTYDDYHLSYRPGSLRPTVEQTRFQHSVTSFRLKLRSYSSLPKGVSRDFKVFAVSEYGDKTFRPHVHALIFGIDWLQGKNLLKHFWTAGHCDVRPIMKGGIRYVLKYLETACSPAYRDYLYFDVGVDAPFTYISRGIGSSFYYAHASDIASLGMIKLGSRFIPVPAYWKNKMLTYSKENLSRIDVNRRSYQLYCADFARNLGFNSYDDYMRQARVAAELNNAARLRKRHSPADTSFVRTLPRLDTFDEYRLFYV